MCKNFVLASPHRVYVILDLCLILDFSMAAKPVLRALRRWRRWSSWFVSILCSCAASSCSRISLTIASCSLVSPIFSFFHLVISLAIAEHFFFNFIYKKRLGVVLETLGDADQGTFADRQIAISWQLVAWEPGNLNLGYDPIKKKKSRLPFFMNDSLEHAVLYSVIILVHISPSPIYPIYIHEAQNISTPKKPGKMHVPPF